MKVALLIERFDPAAGGREKSTAEIAALLATSGCDVSVICKQGHLPDDAQYKIIATNPKKNGRLASAMQFNRSCQKLIAGGKYDISHAMLPVVGADIYQLRSGVIPAVRQANWATSGPLKRLGWYFNLARLYMWQQEKKVTADVHTKILPVSEMVARQLKTFYGRSENVQTVFNGVTVPDEFAARRSDCRRQFRQSWGISDDNIALLCPAMNAKLKGVDYLLEAFGRLQKSDAEIARRLRLVLVGKAMPAAASSCSGVIVLDAVDDVLPLYAASDAAVLLSWYDACSRVVLEAISLGLPCITTQANGAAELLTGGSGIVIDRPNSCDKLAIALREICDNDRREQMARVASQKAPQVSMRRHVDQLLDVYEKIVDSRK